MLLILWGPWVVEVLNVCRIRANLEIGYGRRSFSSYGGREACDLGLVEGLRLRAVVEWASISCTIESPGDVR